MVGSLLDAHPEACIAHEKDVFKYLVYNFSRDQVYHLLLENALNIGRKGRQETGYSYVVPGQYQGDYTNLKVIGDKRGGNTSRWLRDRPEVLNRLQKVIRDPVRFVHVSRNPFDNISTMFYRNNQGKRERMTNEALKHSINDYFSMADAVEHTRQALSDKEFHHVRIEDFLEDPISRLDDLCRFIGLTPYQDYKEACASILFQEPRQSRWEISWPRTLIEEVQQKLQGYPCLKGYEFKT